MKKLLPVINIPQATACTTLQTDYKTQRKNLKRYQQSLTIFRTRLVQTVNQVQSISKSLFVMHQAQSKSRKKCSQVEYYMYNGVRVFGGLFPVFGRAEGFYGDVLKRVVELLVKINKCLNQQKKKYQKNSQLHQKLIKQYASQCYPDTSSIMFILGFLPQQKIPKKQDSFKQSSIIQSSKVYSQFLTQCLNQMQALKQETIEVSEKFYAGGRDMWVGEVDGLREMLDGFEVDLGEVERIAGETGGVVTDRSNKSEGEGEGQGEGVIQEPYGDYEQNNNQQPPEQPQQE